MMKGKKKKKKEENYSYKGLIVRQLNLIAKYVSDVSLTHSTLVNSWTRIHQHFCSKNDCIYTID